MSTGSPRRRQFESQQVLLAALVFFICAFYTVTYGYLAPYSGLDWDVQWFVLGFDESCFANPACAEASQSLEVGDRLTQIDDMTFTQFRADRRLVPFAGRQAGELVLIKFLHNGQEREVRWAMLGPQPGPRLVRLSSLLFWLPFWLAGSIVVLFLRPRDSRRQLLILFNYLTALWIAVGLTSVSRVSGSAVVMRMVTWLMLPIYLHLHFMMPRPVARVKQQFWIALYVLACTFCLLEWFQILPGNAFYFAALLAMAGSLGLLIYRSYRRATDADRLVTRLMLAGIIFGFGPGLALWILPVLLGAPAPGPVLIAIITLAIPLTPLIYIYALYKRRLGRMEFRANRWLSLYSFILFFGAAFVLVFLVAGNWVDMSGPQLTLALIVSLTFVALALWLREPFQRFFDRLVYGTEHHPETIIRTFANEIPRALDRQSLSRLLTREVLPTLLIRQSALYQWSESEVSLVYAEGVPAYTRPDVADQLCVCLDHAGQYIPPSVASVASAASGASFGSTADAPFDWVRLATWIEVGGKRVAFWLLGARDPDDFYPRPDIAMLRTLGNQIGVALETARLVENLERRASELETAYRDLQRLDRLKDEFVQNVSHELRTPLTFLRGYTEVLLAEMLGPLSPQQSDALRIMSDRTDAIIRLVNDIISLQQREVEELVREPVNLATLARSCIEAVEVANQGRASQAPMVSFGLVSPEDAPPVLGDRQRLAQVIDNLLSNAVKFSPQGGVITVRIASSCLEPDAPSAGAEARPAVVLTVEDQGIGIPEEELERIWHRFYQVDGSSRRRFGGLGLGLAIARAIVEAHHGKIWAESRPGEGSTFRLLLPAAPADVPAAPPCLDNASTLC